VDALGASEEPLARPVDGSGEPVDVQWMDLNKLCDACAWVGEMFSGLKFSLHAGLYKCVTM